MSYESRLRQRIDDQDEVVQVERARKEEIRKSGKDFRSFNKLPAQTEMDFWCDKCQEDIKAPAHKSWSHFYCTGSWLSFCATCGSVLVRYINDKAHDPYYERSRKIAIMRAEGEADMLRPDQYGFRTLYGDPHQEWMKQRQIREESVRAKYAAYGLRGASIEQETEEERIKETFDQ